MHYVTTGVCPCTHHTRAGLAVEGGICSLQQTTFVQRPVFRNLVLKAWTVCNHRRPPLHAPRSSWASSRGWDLRHATNNICIAPRLAESGAQSMDGLMKVAKS